MMWFARGRLWHPRRRRAPRSSARGSIDSAWQAARPNGRGAQERRRPRRRPDAASRAGSSNLASGERTLQRPAACPRLKRGAEGARRPGLDRRKTARRRKSTAAARKPEAEAGWKPRARRAGKPDAGSRKPGAGGRRGPVGGKPDAGSRSSGAGGWKREAQWREAGRWQPQAIRRCGGQACRARREARAVRVAAGGGRSGAGSRPGRPRPRRKQAETPQRRRRLQEEERRRVIAHIVLLQPQPDLTGDSSAAPRSRRLQQAGGRRCLTIRSFRPRPPRQARTARLRTADDAGLRVRADHRSGRRSGADAVSARRRRIARSAISSTTATAAALAYDYEMRGKSDVRDPAATEGRRRLDRCQARGKNSAMISRRCGIDSAALTDTRRCDPLSSPFGMPGVQRAQLVDHPAIVAARGVAGRTPPASGPGGATWRKPSASPVRSCSSRSM